MNLDTELQRFYNDVMQSLSAFQRIIITVNKSSDVKSICYEVVKILSNELGLDHCSIMLLDDSGNYVVNQAGVSIRDHHNKGEVFVNRSFKLGEGVAGMVAKNNAAILISDVDNDNRYVKVKSSVDIGSLLCLPVCSGAGVMGVLNLSHNRRNFFSKHHEKVFSVLSSTIGHLVTFVQLQKDLEILNKDLQLTVMERTREIEESHEYLKNIFENASDLIFTIDNAGRFIFLNKKIEELGYRRDELVGQTFDSLLIGEEGIRAFIHVLKQGSKKTIEVDLKGKDGNICQTLCSFTPLKSSSEGISGLLGVAKDITERKMLERKLLQTEKLASMGTFVSGIAHELNNRLLPVLVYSELLQESPIAENELKLIKTINRSAVGAKHIVESLLRFSRQEKPHKNYVNLNTVLNSVINILHYRISSIGVNLKIDLDKSVPMTYADDRQIEQVFVNIINNACDALEMCTDKNEQGNEIGIRSYYSEMDIYFDIYNNGPQIPEDKLEKIFDPFYTSKDVGKGTGLGLSLCYGIVHEHNGDISVQSEAGKTVFTIRIPIITREDFSTLYKSGDDSKGEVRDSTDKKRILIVDDEEEQRDVIRHILMSRYLCSGVGTGEEAIHRLENEAFDMVICDVKMPGIDGPALYEWISAHRPNMKNHILFSTGDILGPRAEKIIKNIGSNYIIKPYNVEELLKKVSNILTDR